MRIERERRRRRSDNTSLALHYQLDACRGAARLDGMLLSDDDGFCLASAGDPKACHEVAAQLPLIGRKVRDFEGVLLGVGGAWRIRMHRFGVPGGELYLCAIGAGSAERDRQLALSRGAVRRILEPQAVPPR